MWAAPHRFITSVEHTPVGETHFHPPAPPRLASSRHPRDRDGIVLFRGLYAARKRGLRWSMVARCGIQRWPNNTEGISSQSTKGNRNDRAGSREEGEREMAYNYRPPMLRCSILSRHHQEREKGAVTSEEKIHEPDTREIVQCPI